MATFSDLFRNYLNVFIQAVAKCSQQMIKQNITLPALDILPLANTEISDIATKIDDEYYFSLLQRLVNNILFKTV